MKRVGVHGAGFIPISGMIGPLGANPWWDPLGENLCVWSAYQPADAASFAASLLDLSGNGNNAGDPGGAATPGWNAINGWIFDGIGDYLTTTFVPDNPGQSQSVLVQFSNGVTALGSIEIVAGMRDRPAGVWATCYTAFQWGAASQVSYGNGGNYTNVAPQLLAGNLAIAGDVGYRDGAVDAASLGSTAATATSGVYIGCMNDQGSAGLFAECYIQAVAIYDCTLTAPQVLAVATAMSLL